MGFEPETVSSFNEVVRRLAAAIFISISGGCTFESSGLAGGASDSADETGSTTAPIPASPSTSTSTGAAQGSGSQSDSGSTSTDAQTTTEAGRGGSTTGETTTTSTTHADSGDSTSGGSTGIEPACPGGISWALDFDDDPTAVDVNSIPGGDWTLRSGDPFPLEQLVGGVWQADGVGPLDTAPKLDFEGLTVFEVRMRSVEEPSESGRGAVMWLNAGYGDGTMSVLNGALALQPDGHQTLRVSTKSDAATDVLLFETTGLDDGFVDVTFELDTTSTIATVWVDGALQDTYGLPAFPTNGNDDRWATLFAWGGAAEFESASVTNCP